MKVLSLVAPAALVAGGQGGRVGCHGEGGNGGAGGAGGDSYTWQTSYTTSYTTYNNGVASTQTQTHYQSHFSRGGERGPTGVKGATPSTYLSAGRDGQAGRLVIRVLGQRRNQADRTFSSRYNLALDQFTLMELEGEHADGVFEFGETCCVTAIVVRNHGANS
jgi:hypothetical protein